MGNWNSVIKQIQKKKENFVKKGGSFDFSYMDMIKKNYPKKNDDGRPFYCKWCTKPMYIAGEMRKKGSILLSCDTDDCIGNIDTPEHIVKKELKRLGLDTKLNFSGRKALLDRMTNQHWMTKFTPP